MATHGNETVEESKDTKERIRRERRDGLRTNQAHPSRRRFNYGAIQRLVKADFLETERSTPLPPAPLKNLTRTTYARIAADLRVSESSSRFFKGKEERERENLGMENISFLFFFSFISLSFFSFAYPILSVDTSSPIADLNKISSRPVLI